jgi:hypothetical protein
MFPLFRLGQIVATPWALAQNVKLAGRKSPFTPQR